MPAHAYIREVPKFGAIAVMADGAMLVAVPWDISLLERVGLDDDAQLGPHGGPACRDGRDTV